MVPRRKVGLLERLGLSGKDLGAILLAACTVGGYLKNNEKIDAASEQGGERYAFLVTQVAQLKASSDSLKVRVRRLEHRPAQRAAAVDTVAPAPRSPGLAHRIWNVLWSPFRKENT